MSKLSEITVAILAGGFGSRLQSKISGKPKALAEIRNHPFLEYLLNQLNFFGFKNIAICTGFLGEEIKKRFGKRFKNLSICYSHEQSPLGTAGALHLALPYLTSETVLVMNGDSFCDIDFKNFWQFHLNKNSKVSIVVAAVNDTGKFGKITLDKNNTIISFQEKKSGKGIINAGIYLINKQLIAQIPEGKEISLEKDVFPNWIGKGFYGYKSTNNFIDIGTPENYNKAENFFTQYQLESI